MNILFQITSDSPLISGGPIFGSAQQILMLKENLQLCGHKVDISASSKINLSNYDIVHITMIGFEDTKLQWLNCRRQHVPVVVKTINSWSNEDWLKDFAIYAAAITVESPDEELMVIGKFGRNIKHKVHRLLPAVDRDIKNKITRWKEKNLVHINGRYDDNKGQFSVIKACKDLELPVVTAGSVFMQEEYNKCLSLEYGDVRKEQTKKQLSDVYNHSRVYVCASEKEICNTSICESIKCGCVVVSSSTNWGNTNYQERGFYVYQYGSEKSLKKQIEKAYYSDGVQQNKFWDEEVLSNKYLEIFKKAVNKKCFL